MDSGRQRAHQVLRESLQRELSVMRNAIVLAAYHREKGRSSSLQIPTNQGPDDYLEYYQALCELNAPKVSIIKRAWDIISSFVKRI